MKRLAAIDIDDTLLGRDGRVSPANRWAIDRLRRYAIDIALATGRSFANALTIHRDLGLSGFIVSDAGASVRHPDTDEVVHQEPLPGELARMLVVDGLTRGLTVLCSGADGVYAAAHDRWTHAYELDAGTHPVRAIDPVDLRDGAWLKITWAAAPGRVAALAPEVAGWYHGRLDTVITHPFLLEFTAAGVNKAVGVAALAGRLGVGREQVLAFGDGDNDKELLAWAGTGVAMAYGRPSARRAARYVSPPGDPETALARAVNMLLDGPCDEVVVPPAWPARRAG